MIVEGPPGVTQRLTWLGFFLALATLTFGVVVLAGSRRDVRQEAERASANLATALERDIARNFAVFDLSLQGAKDALALPGMGAAPAAIRQTALFDRAATAEFLGSILVLDAEGRIVASSMPQTEEAAQLRFADRDYFQAHREVDAGLFLSRPYASRLRGGDASVAISRRLAGPGGGFGGVVMGALRLAYFDTLFSRLDLGAHGLVLLAREDGTLVAPPLGPGHDLGGSGAFRRMVVQGAGSFVDGSLIDGQERLYAFRRIGTMPLVLAVGLATQDVYLVWWRKSAVLGVVLLVLGLGTAALCLLFQREIARRLLVQAALLETAERLRVVAATDSLTGLANRRAFEAGLEAEWRRGARAGWELSLMLLDADHFKAYNDRYGHPAGDLALQRLSEAIRANLHRPSDLAARLGGEEFVALLPETDQEGTRVMAERIRDAVHALAIPHAGSPFGRLTVSIGVVSVCPVQGGDPATLVQLADEAMYRAKAEGRDRVACYDRTLAAKVCSSIRGS